MKTKPHTRFLFPIITVMAIGLLGWQQNRVAQARLEIERLQSENVALAALRDTPAEARPIEIDQAELVRLREDQAARQLELAQARALAARTLRAEAETATVRAQLEQSTTPTLDEVNGIPGPMTEVTQGLLEQRSQFQLARMQERLGLTPFQAEAIAQILHRRARGMGEAMKGVVSGRIDSAKLASLREGSGDPESQILAVLTPDQQESYTQMRDEERAEAALSTANRELLQLRGTVGLRDDQEDPVFDILHAQALQVHYPQKPDALQPVNPAEAMQIVMQRKLEALQEVLTPDQLAGYRQQQELQLRFLKGMMSRIQTSSAQP